jgi:hypothetical protein
MTNLFAIPPIVGEVSSTNAVLLFVTHESIQLKFVLKEEYTIHSHAGEPTRLVIRNLQPDRLYTINCFFKNQNIYTQRLSTYLPKKLLFVSCDYPELDTNETLWDQLSGNHIDLTFHLGDNIYGDTAYKNSDPIEAKYAYHQRYFNTWSRWAPLLRDSQHLMIPDDHEVTDNYQNISLEERALDINGKIALQLVDEYQSALYLKKKFHTQKVGSTVIYLSTRLYLEDLQIEDLRAEADSAKRLILCLSSAPLFEMKGFAGWIINKLVGTEAKWSSERLRRLYDTLFDWLEEDSSREVLLIAGDLHIGCEGEVFKKNRSLKFFVTSPISYHPTPVFGNFYASQLCGEHHFGPYTMKINQAESKRNYMTLDLESNQPKLHFGKTETPKSYWAVIQNFF